MHLMFPFIFIFFANSIFLISIFSTDIKILFDSNLPETVRKIFLFGKRIQIDLINDWNCYFHLRSKLRWEKIFWENWMNQMPERKCIYTPSRICRSRKILDKTWCHAVRAAWKWEFLFHLMKNLKCVVSAGWFFFLVLFRFIYDVAG